MTATPLLKYRSAFGLPVHSLTGVVTEPVAVAVEGATVTVLDGPYKGKSTITDRAGGYALIGLEGGFTVQVTKDGYTAEARGVTVPRPAPSMSKSNRLSSAGTSVATGQSLSSHIPAVKARCAETPGRIAHSSPRKARNSTSPCLARPSPLRHN